MATVEESSMREARAVARGHQEEFVAWLSGHGVDMSKLKLVPAPSGLSWGAVASCALSANTTCASIPLTIALTEDFVLASRVAADAKRLGLHPSVRTLTYIMMLVQRADPSSHFGPYLRAIPVQHTDPVGSWSAAELVLLRGSNLLPATRSRQADLRTAWDDLVPALTAADPTRYPAATLRWCASCRFRRHFHL
jgi:hypothetical protein